jgi:hypothetical protein
LDFLPSFSTLLSLENFTSNAQSGRSRAKKWSFFPAFLVLLPNDHSTNKYIKNFKMMTRSDWPDGKSFRGLDRDLWLDNLIHWRYLSFLFKNLSIVPRI